MQGITCRQLRDFMDAQVKDGKGGNVVFLDRRGLSYLNDKHEPRIGLPPEEETDSADGRTFLRAVF